MDSSRQLYNNFKSVEADLIVLLRYVELSKNNYKTTSAEIRKIILSACSFIELSYPLLLTELKSPDTKKEKESIASAIYRVTKEKNCILSNLTPNIQNEPFTPWNPTITNLDNTYKFNWWEAYNACKHKKSNINLEEIEFFKSAIESVAALFSLTVFLTSKTQINFFWYVSDFIKIQTAKLKPVSIYSKITTQLRKQIWPDFFMAEK